MSRMLSKMNLISVVQQLSKEDIETIQGYVEMIEQENDIQKAMIENFVKENQKLKQQLKQRDNIINKAREYIKTHQRKDEFLDLNEWQTRDLLEILNIDKGDE